MSIQENDDQSSEIIKKPVSDEDILEIAKKRFNLAEEAESDIRKEAQKDLKFSAGEQWEDDVKNSREMDRRPCLTINKLPTFIHQITNDLRQNRPSIKVSPISEGASVETAEIFQGIIRHIETKSSADVAYDRASDSAVRASFGYFRFILKYCNPLSFDQDIEIKSIRNRFSVYLDPSAQEPDGSDAEWGFVFEDMEADDFKAQYPGAKLSQMADWQSLGTISTQWLNKTSCRVAEYFYREYEDKNICQLETVDGSIQVVEKSLLKGPLPQGFKIISERKTQVPVVRHCKINGIEILEKTDWPGKWIPIVPVYGEEIDTGDKVIREGIVRHARDPQRMYNYFASAEAETIALAPRAPFIGAEGQFEGHEAKWQTSNTKNHAYLEYKMTTLGGQQAPPPARNQFEAPVQAVSNARALASEDMKATTGIYDPTLGARSNETSGIAIQRRNTQAQTSNFHFSDNLTRSIRHAGRILVDLIPKIYDTPRVVRILNEDSSEEMIMVNQIFDHKGKQAHYDLDKGEYDVTISTGPSFETKRQEAVASMTDLSKAYPPLMQTAGDLMVRNMDWPGAQEIADRLRKMLPPGIAEDDKNQKIPPQAQQQITQQSQLIQNLTKQLQVVTDEMNKKKYEIDSKERIELARLQNDRLKLQAEIEIELAKHGQKGAEIMLEHQVDSIQHLIDIANSANQSDPQNQNQMGAGSQAAMAPQPNQISTGGASPGQSMGEQP